MTRMSYFIILLYRSNYVYANELVLHTYPLNSTKLNLRGPLGSKEWLTGCSHNHPSGGYPPYNLRKQEVETGETQYILELPAEMEFVQVLPKTKLRSR